MRSYIVYDTFIQKKSAIPHTREMTN